MVKLYKVDAGTYEGLAASEADGFEAMLSKYNDQLADTVVAPENPFDTTGGMTVPSTNPAQAERAVKPIELVQPASLGGIRTPEALATDPAWSKQSYAGRKKAVDEMLIQARAAMIRENQAPGTIATTMANLTKEYGAVLGKAPGSQLSTGGKIMAGINDINNAFGKGVLGGAKSVVDAFGAGSTLSRAFEDELKKYDTEYATDAAKDDQKFQQELVTGLGADPSILDRVATTAKGALRNPGKTVAEGTGSVVTTLAGGAVGLGRLGIAGLSALMGAGAVRGGIYDAVQQAPEAELMTDPVYVDIRAKTDEKTARDALGVLRQSLHEAQGKVAFGALIGGLVGTYGSVEQMAASLGKTMSAGEMKRLVADGYAKVIAKAAGKEVITEAPQEAVETALGNAGAAAGGATIPLDRGVPEAATQAALMSVVPGGAAGAVHRRQAGTQAAPATAEPAMPPVPPSATESTPATAPTQTTVPNTAAAPHASEYAAMGITSTDPNEIMMEDIKSGEMRSIYTVPPAEFEATFGATPSELFGDQVLDAPPPGVVAPGMTPPFQDPQMTPVQESASTDGNPEGVMTATEEPAAPRTGSRPETAPTQLEQVETRRPPDMSQVYMVNADGKPVTMAEAQAAQQEAEQLIASFTEGDTPLTPERSELDAQSVAVQQLPDTVFTGKFADRINKVFADEAIVDAPLRVTGRASLSKADAAALEAAGFATNGRMTAEQYGEWSRVAQARAMRAPAPAATAPATPRRVGKKKEPVTETPNDVTPASPESGRREGQATTGQGDGDTPTVAGPQAGVAGRVDQGVLEVARARSTAKARGVRGRADTKTAGRADAVAEWSEYSDGSVAFDKLGARARQAWTDAVGDGRPTIHLADELTRDTKALAVQDKIASEALTEAVATARDESRSALAAEVQNTALGRRVPLSAEAVIALRSDNINGALDAIAQMGSTPLARAIAARFRESGLGAVKISIGAPESVANSGRFGTLAATYNPKTRTMTLHPELGLDEHVFLHEAAHAATLEGIENPKTPAQKAAVMELYSVYNDTAARLQADKTPYALDSVQEFVAEAYGNPKFQQQLKDLKTPAGQSFWGRVRNAFLRVTGLDKIMGLTGDDNLLGRTLAAADALLAAPDGGLYRTVALRIDDVLNKIAPERAAAAANTMRKRPNESWTDWVARKLSAYAQPMFTAERGYTVVAKDGKELGSFADLPTARAVQSANAGSVIDERRGMFTAETSPGKFTETMANRVAAGTTESWAQHVKPFTDKLNAFYKGDGRSAYKVHKELNLVANALSALDANRVGRAWKTALTPTAEAQRMSIYERVVLGTLPPTTGMRLAQRLVAVPTNRALDAQGNPVPIYETMGGITDAAANKILADHPEAAKFLSQTAKPELDAIRDHVKQLNKDALQFDARAMRVLDMYGQQNYFPLRGREAGGWVDVPPGFSPTETPSLHLREGRQGLAETPLDNLIADVHTANQRVVEKDRANILWRQFLKMQNGTPQEKANAKRFFKHAGIQYDHSSVLDATQSAKNANEPAHTSSTTIVARVPERNGSGKVRQIFFTINPYADGGQRGANYVSAWSGSLVQPSDNIALKGLTAMTRGTSSMFTRLNPTFAPIDLYRTHKWLASMLAGDFGAAPSIAYAKYAAVANPVTIGKILAGAKNVNSDVATALDEMRAEGGLLTYHTATGQTGASEKLRGAGRFGGQAKDTATHILDVYNEAYEYSPRVAAYMALREHGVSKAEASLWALRTANFSMQGEWTNNIRAVVPFFNPAAQGVRRVADVLHQVKIGNRRAQLMVGGRMLMAAATYVLANSLIGKDDEGQDELDKMAPSKVYRNNYLPNPLTGELVALPRPIDAGFIDGVGIAAARVALGHTTAADAVKEWATEGLQRLSPVEAKEYHGVLRSLIAAFSGGFRPLYEVSVNETGLGTPIANDSEKAGKIAALNGRSTTPQAYKDIAAALHGGVGVGRYAPEDVRHVVTNYGAWFGQTLDSILSRLDDTQAPRKGDSKLLPLVGRFTESRPETRPRFYNMFERAGEAAKELNSRPEADRAQWRVDNPEQAQLADMHKETDTALRNLSRTQRASGQTPADSAETTHRARARIQDDFIRRYREVTQ